MRTRNLAMGMMVLLSAAAVLTAQSGEEMLRQCRTKDRVDSDIPGAIQCFERVVREFAMNRIVLADAHLELARLYESSNALKAKQHYETVAAMSDQPTKAAEANTRLKALDRDPYPSITIPTPNTDDVFSFAISPDGLSVVYQATVDGKSHLWLWRDYKAGPIPGTENAREWALPFWSPDGKNIGFFAEQKLKTIPVEGGVPKKVADVGDRPRGGTWNSAGLILFALDIGPIYKVPADGSDLPAAVLQPGLQSHYPRFLPDGRSFIFWQVNGGSVATQLATLDTASSRPLPSGPGAAYVSPDQLYFADARRHDGIPHFLSLTRQRVDLSSSTLLGSPDALGTTIGLDTRWPGLAALSVSDKGRMAYRTEALFGRQLIWVDRSGHQRGALGQVDKEMLPINMRFSADGERIVLYRSNGGIGTLWLMDTESSDKFLFKEGARTAVFSPKGDEIIFTQLAFPIYSLFRQPRDAFKSAASRIVGTTAHSLVLDASGDGHVLYVSSPAAASLATSRDILAVPLKGGEPIPVATTSATETNGRFSPDSHWVAYQSDEIGGRFEIFVQRFPDRNSRRQVSTNAGTMPQWSRDGREIYFLSADDHVMVMDVTQGPDGDIQIGTPQPMFPKPLRHGSTFEMAPDGKRLLVNAPVEDPAPIVLLPNGPRIPTP